jgi:hypothetical protein
MHDRRPEIHEFCNILKQFINYFYIMILYFIFFWGMKWTFFLCITSRPNVFTSIPEDLNFLMVDADHKFKTLVRNKTEM